MDNLSTNPNPLAQANQPLPSSEHWEYFLVRSATFGDHSLLSRLLDVMAPIQQSVALQITLAAIQRSDAPMVHTLIPHCQLKDKKSRCLVAALTNANQDIVDLLLPHSNIPLALKQMSASAWNSPAQLNMMGYALRYHNSIKERRSLTHATRALDNQSATLPKKRM